MAVPTYPSAISLAAVQTEFGGSNPIAMNEYYAGGSYVGSGTANATSVSIPTSGAINFLHFSGAQALTANIVARTIGDIDYNEGYVKAYSLYRANGQYSSIVGTNTVVYNNTWLVTGNAGDFEVRFTKYSGTTPQFVNSANNTWYAMSTDRGFYLESTSGSIYAACLVYVTVRKTVGGAEVANVVHQLVIESKK